MNRGFLLLAAAILAGAPAASGIACTQNHYDMYLGTDAGAAFEAPVSEVEIDAPGDDAGAGDQVDAGAGADAD